jgi:hypothetical protein
MEMVHNGTVMFQLRLTKPFTKIMPISRSIQSISHIMEPFHTQVLLHIQGQLSIQERNLIKDQNKLSVSKIITLALLVINGLKRLTS